MQTLPLLNTQQVSRRISFFYKAVIRKKYLLPRPGGTSAFKCEEVSSCSRLQQPVSRLDAAGLSRGTECLSTSDHLCYVVTKVFFISLHVPNHGVICRDCHLWTLQEQLDSSEVSFTCSVVEGRRAKSIPRVYVNLGVAE